MHGGMNQMNQHQMAMMQRMRLQQNPAMMRGGDQMPNMMQSNGGGPMEMMGPNGMMMRNMGPMGGMPRTSGHPMMQGPGNGMMHGMNMMGPGHPGNHPNMSHGMPGNRPPPPEYHSQQVGPRLFYFQYFNMKLFHRAARTTCLT